MNGRVLGVDVGARRVGLAISDASRTLARPLETIDRDRARPTRSSASRERIDAARRAKTTGSRDRRRAAGAARRHADAADARACRRSSTRCRRGRPLPIATEDERLTSREAESRLAVRERDWRKRKEKLDAAAAAVILQDYLDRPRPMKRLVLAVRSLRRRRLVRSAPRRLFVPARVSQPYRGYDGARAVRRDSAGRGQPRDRRAAGRGRRRSAIC